MSKSPVKFMSYYLCAQESGPSLNFEEAYKICSQQVLQPKDFACVQLVYGRAGW